MAEYSNALILTTPHEKGQRVKDAQYLLKGNNAYPGLAPFKDQVIDGDYGSLTAQAAARAKYWLGYQQAACTPTFGQPLYNLLTGKSKLTIAQNKLRQARLNNKTIGQKALEYAQTQIGYKEEPEHNVNDNKYGRWYGFNKVPWCAIFESYCCFESGYKKYHYAACEAIYYDALANRNNLRQVWTPQEGDIVIYNERGDRFAHTAFFVGWANQDLGTFTDLGGNTGLASMSNGGEVAEGTRNKSIVTAFVRIG